MNRKMNTSIKIWAIIIVALTAIAFLAALWASYTLPSPQFPERPLPSQYIRGDLEFYYIMQAVISTVNIVLLVFLLTIYVDVYRKTRSQFTVGLIIFSSVFLLRALTANPLFMSVFGFRAFGLGPFALLPDLFEFVALTVLMYLSIKY
jgi:hypothetical protein